MSWREIAIVVGAIGVVLFLLGVWALMAAASDADDWVEQQMADLRRKQWPKDKEL